MYSESEPRVMARHLARELTEAELNLVSGGGGGKKPPPGGCELIGTGCDEWGCYDLDCK